jgi:hypothetical protein
MEHRWGERVSVDIPILLRRHARRSAEARIANISQSGALIRTNLPLPLMGRVDIHVNGHALSSFVTRIESSGVGVEWCELSPKILEMALHAQHAAAIPTPALHRAGRELAALRQPDMPQWALVPCGVYRS